MRQPIEGSPRDGTAIILEDEASGTYDVGHWSAEMGEWLGENGKPTGITPTHWYPIPRDRYLGGEDEGSIKQAGARRGGRLAAAAAITLLAAAFIAIYFRAEVAAHVTRYSGQEDPLRINAVGRYVTGLFAPQGARTGSLAAAGQVEAGTPSAPAALQAAQVQQSAAVPVADQPQSPKENHAEGSAQKPAAPRRALDGPEAQSEAEAAQRARSLEEARKQADALALEAATARTELAAGIEQHRQAVEEERGLRAAIRSELATAQREIEAQAAQLRQAGLEAEQLRKAVESATVELRQYQQRERVRAEAMARARDTARRTVGARVRPQPAAGNPVSLAAQPVR